jgi:hypothetical protein
MTFRESLLYFSLRSFGRDNRHGAGLSVAGIGILNTSVRSAFSWLYDFGHELAFITLPNSSSPKIYQGMISSSCALP